jgi:hypothetical protein
MTVLRTITLMRDITIEINIVTVPNILLLSHAVVSVTNRFVLVS